MDINELKKTIETLQNAQAYMNGYAGSWWDGDDVDQEIARLRRRLQESEDEDLSTRAITKYNSHQGNHLASLDAAFKFLIEELRRD